MKKKIHPKYTEAKFICACGSSFDSRTTLGQKEVKTEICSQCHPFFTGKQKLLDSAGRVERFNKKYNRDKK